VAPGSSQHNLRRLLIAAALAAGLVAVPAAASAATPPPAAPVLPSNGPECTYPQQTYFYEGNYSGDWWYAGDSSNSPPYEITAYARDGSQTNWCSQNPINGWWQLRQDGTNLCLAWNDNAGLWDETTCSEIVAEYVQFQIINGQYELASLWQSDTCAAGTVLPFTNGTVAVTLVYCGSDPSDQGVESYFPDGT
jgi:hypothetical protein